VQSSETFFSSPGHFQRTRPIVPTKYTARYPCWPKCPEVRTSRIFPRESAESILSFEGSTRGFSKLQGNMLPENSSTSRVSWPLAPPPFNVLASFCYRVFPALICRRILCRFRRSLTSSPHRDPPSRTSCSQSDGTRPPFLCKTT